jgi:hypothetical protein
MKLKLTAAALVAVVVALGTGQSSGSVAEAHKK